MPATVSEVATSADRPGAMSRYFGWSGSLPWNGRWIYPALAAGLFAWGHGVLWASGTIPVGEIDPTLAAGVVYGPFILAALAYLNGVALQSLAAFWPATAWPDDERPTWARAFVTTPRGLELPCVAIGVVLAVGSFLGAPPSVVGSDETSRWAFFVALAPSTVFGYTMVPVAFLQTARQLRLVARIHREARAIDPFDRGPVYAFSRLTVRTGLAYLASGYYTLTVNEAFQAGNAIALVTLTAVIGLGAVCFVVPLWGIHDRLVREKDALLAGVEVRAGALGLELYRRIDAGEYDSTKVVSEAIAGVGSVRERISRLPTWPWPPQLFRGFLSALLLPVIVYLMSRLIGGRIGL